MLNSHDVKAGTVTDNYLDVKHEYFGLPNDEGVRVRTVDVWYATRPTSPEFSIVNHLDQVIDDQEASVTTGWCIEKAGMDRIYIFDRDDINGLRALLDRLEQDFDRRDMDALHASMAEVDNSDEDE